MTKVIPAKWQSAVLICGKCSKKVGGGFGPKGKTRLAKALRKLVGGPKGRKGPAGIIETSCLKLCPKDAVVAIDGKHPDQWLLIRPGASVEAVADRLGLEH